MRRLVFDFPLALQAGLPLALAALAFAAWLRARHGMPKGRVTVLAVLRAAALLAVAFLAANPTWVTREPPDSARRPVLLLMDRSESMSLEDGEKTRYQQALDFARNHLLPALKSSDIPVQALLFAEDTEPADGGKLALTPPNGRRTNLGGAIARALASAATPPLAVVALTDGMANESADNARGLSALVESRVPFVGVGFGSDTGARTLSLRQVDAPPVIATNTLFRVSAQLEMLSSEEVPPFDLVLMRDGQVAEKKTVQPGKGTRFWLESFQISEAGEGSRRYTIQFLPPNSPGLKCVNTMASASVLVSSEKELRVLYVQGALTWDYKFAVLALKGDPTVKLTGLTRTSKQSVFRQNVENAGELTHGFPTSLEEMAPFRVVVLAHLKPIDLSPAQQELLTRFCSELGGGVLMIGGPASFNSSWQGSRLEQLLPVTFSANQGVLGLDRPFRLKLTEAAWQHPVFQVASDRPTRDVWAQLPAFSQYGRVDGAKPGAQVWAEHPDDQGPRGKRILLASQRFGAGVSAVICMQNFWRWRLAKESDPAQFDRFWRQLFRYLSEPSRQDVTIHLADGDLHPQMDIRLSFIKQAKAVNAPGMAAKFFAQVQDESQKTVAEQMLELPPNRAVDMSFRAEKAGLYKVSVHDGQKQVVATRTVEIRDVNLEFQNTARNMETLRQWASLSGGLALEAEACQDANELVSQMKSRVEQARRTKPARQPAGVNGWMLAALLASLVAEWVLRKRWSLA